MHWERQVCNRGMAIYDNWRCENGGKASCIYCLGLWVFTDSTTVSRSYFYVNSGLTPIIKAPIDEWIVEPIEYEILHGTQR